MTQFVATPSPCLNDPLLDPNTTNDTAPTVPMRSASPITIWLQDYTHAVMSYPTFTCIVFSYHDENYVAHFHCSC